uniref:Uncharacterized protein n=1 Tax=Streptomyces sp. NBC_00093 TaxID=2975649 RepID=A0AAU2AI84_9ACTN
MRLWMRSGAVAVAAALALGMAPGIRPGLSAAAETAPTRGTAHSGGRTVTLITGDTVTTDGAGRVTGVRRVRDARTSRSRSTATRTAAT